PRAQLVKTQRFHRYKCPQFFALTDGPVPFVVIIKSNYSPLLAIFSQIWVFFNSLLARIAHRSPGSSILGTGTWPR
ncbi:hypothetical protein, partial [Thiolapillus sp.]|uniref:hypothetical protein n=1 Tax=Thiolapillus sp. TaxID=2017437 RepID=UPI0025F1CE34